MNDGPRGAWQGHPTVVADENGHVYASWADWRFGPSHVRVARLLPAPEYYDQGRYTSPVFDAGVPAEWRTLAWRGILPTGTSLSFETRSRMPGSDWSEWTTGSGFLTTPPGQYFQYRVTLTTTSPDRTSALEWIQLAYRAVGAPSAPRFATPCGVTNQRTPTLSGSAAAGSTIHLYVDGTETLTTTADAEGAFTLSPSLAAGAHTLTAAAENEQGLGPASAGLSLTISPALAYDPLNVRAGQWSKDGWLMAPPRDDQGCADPANGWQVWPRADQRFRVEVPVSYTVSAAVTVTVGADSLTLTEESTGLFVGVFEPPIQAGAFRIEVTADGQRTVADGGPVLIDPDGVVYEATGTLSDTIAGVEVTLYYSDTHTGLWLPWDARNYDQVNPQVTLEDGYYSFSILSG